MHGLTLEWGLPLKELPLILILLVVSGSWAQSPADRPAAATQPAGATSSPPGGMPDSEAIEQQLMDQLEKNPVIYPTQPTGQDATENHDVPLTAGADDVDPRVLGVAPGSERPKLRREGEFIVDRRGRIVQATNGRQMLFVFEADSSTAPEPPMVMTPCQMLQNMEDIVRERGDNVVFVLSGQVLVYRGVNYMLPVMMKMAIDRGNLEN